MSGLIVDNFAGGGGASLGIEMATGRAVDIAVNHDAGAVEMHTANHPHTLHLREDVFKVSPRQVCGDRPVDIAWFSPDCRHHSKAKGGKPVDRKIRGLAWVAVKWAQQVRPRLIALENVEEFQDWGPLMSDGKGGKKPDPARKGLTFRQFVGRLRGFGYTVDWRELVAADFGVPTTRKRLFLIARCDGEPIIWPEPTHAKNPDNDLLTASRHPWRTAAECIDWSLPCPSIFERKKPLAEATLRRIANGIRRYVIQAKQPFIVRAGHYSNITGEGAHFRGQSVENPVSTVTAVNDRALVMPHVVEYHSAKYPGDDRVKPLIEPLPTQTCENRFALATPQLVAIDNQSSGDGATNRADSPLRTITTENRFALVNAFLAKHYGGVVGQRMDAPIGTITAIDHHSLVTAALGAGDHGAEVRAFLVKYYGNERGAESLLDPMDTVTTRDRLGLVVVRGVEYRIMDIGLRMLQPRELARAQGFPDAYTLTGTKTSQVARIGNSVCPPLAAAIIRANAPWACREEAVA